MLFANRGLADQVKGAAKETWGNAKDAADEVTRDDRANARANASGTIDNVKDRINEKIDAVREQHRQNEGRTA